MKRPDEPLALSALSDAEVKKTLAGLGIHLTPDEARSLIQLLGREPTLSEAHLFNIMWSEHCSYKSSRALLAAHLPTDGPNVIQGPAEDAGIVEFIVHEGVRYGIVFAHESHNHPSQVVPNEGAATGIGGIVRDVYCMGGEVFAVLDPLRFGDPTGPVGTRSAEIAAGVVDGIWQYGNPLGVPNLGGDAYFSEKFDDNCLVNVVAVGLVRADEIIHSRVPDEARRTPYVYVLVGKATDDSGFGGAAFASVDLDSGEENRGAVQVPDPFLSRVLTEANKAAWRHLRAKGLAFGMKDLGAGGIACATSEMAAAAGLGADVHLDKVPVSMEGLPPYIVACGETQERYMYAVPVAAAEEFCKIFNTDWELGKAAVGAAATVIGEILPEDRYRLLWKGTAAEEIPVCDVSTRTITHGIKHDRPRTPPAPRPVPARRKPDLTWGEVLKKMLASPNGCSRYPIFKRYDCEVQGRTVLRPGEADAGVVMPLSGCPAGVAMTADGNPRLGEVDPYLGAVHAVAEAARNVACTGAAPAAITDCLNYGNPEKPEIFFQFAEGLRGIGDACRGLGLVGHPGAPLPVVSGNVSFYNQSAQGKAVPPSPVIACVGVIADARNATGQCALGPGEELLFVGKRRPELGGSLYYETVYGDVAGEPPPAELDRWRTELAAIVEFVGGGKAIACHDVSDGGLALCLAEIALGTYLSGGVGLEADMSEIASSLKPEALLFNEAPGYILTVRVGEGAAVVEFFKGKGCAAALLGRTTDQRRFTLTLGKRILVAENLDELRGLWSGGLEKIFGA
ncbi:MAG: phosphoribosylformylglycinamidine synthase subunit PurL [bacterium]|nr:phosphoribosylformylglycinamidine synthase subunit PurL [bacterium]